MIGGQRMKSYADTIRGGLLNLRFTDEDLEKEFIAFNDMSNRRSNQNGTRLSYVVWAILILISFLFYRGSLLTVSLPILGILYPYLAIELIVMSKTKYMKYYQALCTVGNLFFTILSIALTFLVMRDPFVGTLFFVGAIMYAFFMLRIRYTLAATTTLIDTAICQLVVILCGLFDEKYVAVISFAIWVFQFILLIAGRELEIATRRYFSEQKSKSQLLTSILPLSVAEELQQTGSSKPVRIESATILFSDFVHFTTATKGIDPISIVALLTGYFTSFDSMAETHHVERLKTIGDGYMCAAGIPDISRTHAIDICLLALDMLQYVKDALRQQDGSSWNIRIGINTGSVTAGIIGRSKFSYDIWGEAVNVASRHESSGTEGAINVSKSTYLLTKNFFNYHPRGQVEIKGGDMLDMYELVGIKAKYMGESGLNAEYQETYGKIAKGEILLGFDV
jgi:class 3 adenylate cyclase